VHVDPINPTLKAPGTERLILNCDEPLSNFAFNFSSRRYGEGSHVCVMNESDDEAHVILRGCVAVQAGAYTRPLFSST
jgi:hypothetical protein